MKPKDKADHDDHSNQLKPNNDAYWQSRGNDSRPEDWDDDDDRNNSYDDYVTMVTSKSIMTTILNGQTTDQACLSLT